MTTTPAGLAEGITKRTLGLGARGERAAMTLALGPKRPYVALALGVLMLALAASGCGGSEGESEVDQAAQGESAVWRHGVITPKGDAMFSALYAQSKEFFEQQGVQVEIKEFEGSQQVTQALLAGELDSAENNADPVIRALAQGGEVTAIGSSIPGLAYNLYSKQSITSFDQLEGATVGVSKPGAFPDLIARAMLAKQGLDPESVRLVNAGDDATRYKALVAGRVDATAVSTEFAPQADEDGVRVLGEAGEIVPEWPRFIVWANPESLESNPDAAVAFLAGLMDGLQHALDNKAEAIQFVADEIGLSTDDPRLTYTYEVQSPLVSPTLEIPIDKLEFVADFLTQIGAMGSSVDVQEHVDGSFREQAMERAGTGGT